MTSHGTDYVPVLRYRVLTPLYDAAIAMLTREKRWRSAVLSSLDPKLGEKIVDIGCGTGSLLGLIQSRGPAALLFGVDPDPEIVARAKKKLGADSDITLINEMGDVLDDHFEAGSVDAVVITLVLHQVPLHGKDAIIRAAFRVLKPNGKLIIGDYGIQPNWLMKQCFKIIQNLDGYDLTQPNADGVLPDLASKAGFSDVVTTAMIKTPTGAISVIVAKHGDGGLSPLPLVPR